jgi:rubredoxin
VSDLDSGIRGSLIGAGPMGESERGDSAPRHYVSYYCANGHVTRPAFAADAQIPEEWDCPKCGLPANQHKDNPPPPPHIRPYKTHLAYVKERRNDAESKEILDEAMDDLRRRRAAGEVIY